MGLETPYVPWGCHPELIEVAPERRARRPRPVTYVFPGGFLGHRKPLEPVLEAFEATEDPRLRLRRQGPGRAQAGPRRRGGGRARPADRAAARRPADRRAPARARELRRLPRAGALGGARAAALRGDRLRPAGDHQRRAADERGDPRRRQRAARRLARRTGPRSRGSRRSTPTSTSCAAAIERLADDDAARRARRRRAARPRRASAAGSATVAGIGDLLKSASNG